METTRFTRCRFGAAPDPYGEPARPTGRPMPAVSVNRGAPTAHEQDIPLAAYLSDDPEYNYSRVPEGPLF